MSRLIAVKSMDSVVDETVVNSLQAVYWGGAGP